MQPIKKPFKDAIEDKISEQKMLTYNRECYQITIQCDPDAFFKHWGKPE